MVLFVWCKDLLGIIFMTQTSKAVSAEIQCWIFTIWYPEKERFCLFLPSLTCNSGWLFWIERHKTSPSAKKKRWNRSVFFYASEYFRAKVLSDIYRSWTNYRVTRWGTLKRSSHPEGIIRFIDSEAGCHFKFLTSAVQREISAFTGEKSNVPAQFHFTFLRKCFSLCARTCLQAALHP